MMIRIEIGKGRALRGRSLFLSLSPGDELSRQVIQLKSLPKYVYSPADKIWEISTRYFDKVLNVTREWDLEIIGDIPPDIQKRIDLENAMMDQEEDFSNVLMKTKPFQHQLDAYQYAKTHDKFILGDEQGLGKTKTAIDIAVSRKHMFKHCLIVCCVNGLKWNWEDEIRKHSNEKCRIIGEYTSTRGLRLIKSVKDRTAEIKSGYNDEFFLITNIETLRDKEFAEVVRLQCIDGTIGMCIIDEIHKCKNPNSKQGKGMLLLHSYFRIGLSGTPLMNSPVDLYTILKWVGVEQHSFTDFKYNYCIFGSFGDTDIVGYKNLDQLRDTLDSVMLRRRKKDVLDLPPKLHSTQYLEMSPDQSKIYEEVLTSIRENIDKVRLYPNPLTATIRLRQATGYPGILSSSISRSVKFERALEIIEEATQDGEKCIVFSNWLQVVNPFFELLKKNAYDPAIITGEVKDSHSQMMKFMESKRCKVIIGTTGAMGTGFTLTAGSTVIFLDSPWTRAEKDQAEDRAHRIGTKGTVNVITLVCRDTIDEKIEHIVNRKGLMSDSVVDKMDVTKQLEILDFLIK